MADFTVLGGTGFVGQHLTHSLRRMGHGTITPGRDAMKNIEGDLGNVIYLIGLTADFRTRIQETVEAHASLLSRIISNCAINSLTYVSTARIYRNEGTDQTTISVNPEEHDSVYDLSKLLGESLVLNSEIRTRQVVRLSNVVGATSPSESFFSHLVEGAKSGQVNLNSSLDSCKDYVHVEDASTMLALIASRGSSGVYDVGGGKQVATETWLQGLSRRFNFVVKVSPNPVSFRYPAVFPRRVEKEFGVIPGSALRVIEELI